MYLNRMQVEVGQKLAPLTKTITKEKIDQFEALANLLVLNGPEQELPVNIHTDPQQAKERGLTQPVASGQMSFSYLHELLARRFGIDFRQGGELAVTFLKPVYDGDEVTVEGTVTGKEAVGDRTQLALDVWVENQRGEKTTVGKATVTVPSPLT